MGEIAAIFRECFVPVAEGRSKRWILIAEVAVSFSPIRLIRCRSWVDLLARTPRANRLRSASLSIS